MAANDSQREQMRLMFGTELRDLREKNGWSQKALAQKLWEEDYRVRHDKSKKYDQTKISDWETGTRAPSEVELQVLVKHVDISYAEEVKWYGLCGYIPFTRMPTYKQVRDRLEAHKKRLRASTTPAYIADHIHGRFWMANHPIAELIGGVGNVPAYFRHSIFDLAFNTRIGMSARIVNIDEVRKDQVETFQGINQFRQHDPFYRSYPSQMRSHKWTAEDYAVFESMWNAAAKADSTERTPIKNDFISICINDTPCVFELTPRFIQELANFFWLVIYQPVDPNNPLVRDLNIEVPRDNLANIEKIFSKYGKYKGVEEPYKIWDTVSEVEIEELLLNE